MLKFLKFHNLTTPKSVENSMKYQTISYLQNGKSLTAKVQLISPAAWIFVVDTEQAEPFHLEYDEDLLRWEVIDDVNIEEAVISAISEELFKTFIRGAEPTASNARSEYFLFKNDREEIICFWDAELRIRVVPFNENSVFATDEVVYYGNIFGKPLAFQTIDYQNEAPEVIEAAINWYASELNYPQMVFSKKNPLAVDKAVALLD